MKDNGHRRRLHAPQPIRQQDAADKRLWMRNPSLSVYKSPRRLDEAELTEFLDEYPRKIGDPERHPASMKIERGPTMRKEHLCCPEYHPASACPAERGPTVQVRLRLMEPLLKKLEEG